MVDFFDAAGAVLGALEATFDGAAGAVAGFAGAPGVGAVAVLLGDAGAAAVDVSDFLLLEDFFDADAASEAVPESDLPVEDGEALAGASAESAVLLFPDFLLAVPPAEESLGAFEAAD